jgi:hypothetical protein
MLPTALFELREMDPGDQVDEAAGIEPDWAACWGHCGLVLTSVCSLIVASSLQTTAALH